MINRNYKAGEKVNGNGIPCTVRKIDDGRIVIKDTSDKERILITRKRFRDKQIDTILAD